MGARYRVFFDGMIHYLDIPKANKAEHDGIVRCHVKNSLGEVETTCRLKVNPKLNYRSVLKVVKTEEIDDIVLVKTAKAETPAAVVAKKAHHHITVKAPQKVMKVVDSIQCSISSTSILV